MIRCASESGVAQTELLRFSTAGSVDDGKSTLLGRLLFEHNALYEDQIDAVRDASARLNGQEIDYSFFLDGLKAEREQGITIDVAYRYFATPRRRFIVADTPGHEQYTRNMVTAASTADLTILLVDVTRGLRPQSKRHAFVASLMGIEQVVVAVNKMDLADWSEAAFTRVREAFGEFAEELRIPDVTFIPISALHGDNIIRRREACDWYDGPTLLEKLETCRAGGRREHTGLRLPVQLAIRGPLGFRGYAGQIASGVLRVGDEVEVLPKGIRSRVQEIRGYDGPAESAFAPQSVAVVLEDEIDVARGDILAHPEDLPSVGRELDAMVVWMSEQPLRCGQPYLVKHATATVRAQVAELAWRVDPETLRKDRAETLGLNDIGRVAIETFRPLATDAYARNRATGGFIVIDPLTNATVGAGTVVSRIGEPPDFARKVERVPAARHLTRVEGSVLPSAKARLLGQSGTTLWLTGLSGAGKSTIAYALEAALVERGHLACVLDGDNLRHRLNADLAFGPADRRENVRRVAEVARLFNDNGVIVLCSLVSPLREMRAAAREVVGPERFVEVFVDAPLPVCEDRDPKGLYRKARAGEIPSFTGISATYEAPEHPDLRLQTDRLTSAEAVARLLRHLESIGAFDPRRTPARAAAEPVAAASEGG